MKRIGAILEATLAALAFTDAGEFDTALAVFSKAPRLDLKCFLKRAEEDLIAITFAEAGCF